MKQTGYNFVKIIVSGYYTKSIELSGSAPKKALSFD